MKGDKFSEIIEGLPPQALASASHADRARNAPTSCCFIALAALPTIGLMAGVRELWLIILTISLWILAGIVVILDVRAYLKTQKEKVESDKGTSINYNDNSDIFVTLNEIENNLQQIKITNNYDKLHDLNYYCNYLLENYPKMRTHLKSLLQTSLNIDSLIKKMQDDTDKDALSLLFILEHPKAIEFAAHLSPKTTRY
jgi:hypothetical protein